MQPTTRRSFFKTLAAGLLALPMLARTATKPVPPTLPALAYPVGTGGDLSGHYPPLHWAEDRAAHEQAYVDYRDQFRSDIIKMMALEPIQAGQLVVIDHNARCVGPGVRASGSKKLHAFELSTVVGIAIRDTDENHPEFNLVEIQPVTSFNYSNLYISR